jgi:hypothetical protein
VNGPVLDRAEKLLEQYFKAVERQMLFEATQARKISEKDVLLHKAKIESFYVRGDMYPHQFYAFAQDLYGPHNAWFRERHGFSISDALKMSNAIKQEYNERINRSLVQSRTEASKKADELIGGHVDAAVERPELEARIFCALHFGRSDRLFAFTPEQLAEFSCVSLRTSQCFLKRMSQEFGYRNPSFPNSFTDPSTAPWDYNTLNERPIVGHGGEYWLFLEPLLHSALFSTFYFDLVKDDKYRPAFEDALGRYLEASTAECLRRVFPPEMILLNPYYPNGEEMADVMVLHDHKVLLFQCKSKILTYPARIGADFEVLRGDVRKAIADAFKQGIRGRDYLRANKCPEFDVGQKRLALDMAQVNGLYLVTVTSTSFQSLAGRFANTNSALGLFSAGEYPWSLSLGDLDVLTQVLTSPAEFLHYALRRGQVERTTFEVHADEMDYLGLYLTQGIRLDVDDFAGMDHVALSGFSSEVDRWVHEKFELGRNVDPPRISVADGFLEFVRDVERTGDDYRTDCAIALLEHSWRSSKHFAEMVGQTKERSRQDKAVHSFSVLLKGGKRGFSFVSFDANADRTRLFKQAAAFAMLKKYQSKCDEWAGFGWDIASTHEVDVAFFVSQPWLHDEQMDGLVKDKLRPSHRIE